MVLRLQRRWRRLCCLRRRVRRLVWGVLVTRVRRGRVGLVIVMDLGIVAGRDIVRGLLARAMTTVLTPFRVKTVCVRETRL